METIDFDLPCVKCGYNLRTLRGDGKCPECATCVEVSRIADARRREPLLALRDRGVPWMRSVRDGMYLAIAGAIVAGLHLVTASPRFPTPESLILWAIVSIVPLWAMWHWFSPGSRMPNLVARVLILLTMIAVFADAQHDGWVPHHFIPWSGVSSLEDWYYAALDCYSVVLPTLLPLTYAVSLVRYAYLCRFAGRPICAGVALLAATLAACYLVPEGARPYTIFGFPGYRLAEAALVLIGPGLLIASVLMIATLSHAIAFSRSREPNSDSSPSPRPPA